MSRSARTAYQHMDVFAMSPARRVVFLYTQLVANLRQARAFLEEGKIEERQSRLFKALDIVEILLSALDTEEPRSELTPSLSAIYVYFLRELVEVDIRNDGASLDRLIRMAESLLEAWTGAANDVGATMAPAASA